MASESSQSPEERPDEEIYREVSEIVSQFHLYQCDEAVQAVAQWLENRGLKGIVLRIKTRYDEDYILSQRLESQGITESITLNGQHYGIEVQGLVFDNLSATGLTREDWLNDFQSISGEFVITEFDSTSFKQEEEESDEWTL
ncbi:MAG: papain fold toxin domain-containing protein [Actinomycetota bacterium]